MEQAEHENLELGLSNEYTTDNYSIDDEDREYDAYLCRGGSGIYYNISKRFTCFLLANQPFLRLAPIKTEEVYIDPDIFIFYNVISDKEIEHVKTLAQSKMTRAGIVDYSGHSIPSNSRISKVAWLEDSGIVSRISQRVNDITQLYMATAEPLQIVNYGVGGYYESHYDFARKPGLKHHAHGNRIATVLFYLSEVAQGGATVFPELGLSVYPIKNAALFWTNLLPSGDFDLLTLHCACPVLNGSKWIATKWIHEVGQEFIKPCNLKYQDENKHRQALQYYID